MSSAPTASGLGVRWTDVALTGVALGLVLFAVVRYYCTSTFDTWKKLGVPYVRPVPLFGNYLTVAFGIDHPVDAYRQIYHELAGHRYGGYFQMRTPYLMVRDPELIGRVLIKDFWRFPNRGIYTNYDAEPLQNNLIFMDNQHRWKTIRNKLSPAFTSGRLKTMYDQIQQCSDAMIDNFRKQLERNPDETDIRNVFQNYSIDVIGTCIFGLTLNVVNDDDSEFRKYGNSLFGSSLMFHVREIIVMISPKLLNVIKIPSFSPKAIEFLRSVFENTMVYRKKNNITRNDFFNTLMQARDELVLNDSLPDNERFTEMHILSNAFAMFSAGFETTATSASFCLYELAFKKHIQEKVREEINLTKSKHNGVIDGNFLADLNYLDMVIAETLRKYPVVFALFREAAERYQMPNDKLVIEKGQKIMVPIHSIHYDPQYYTDPTEFIPERFLPEEKAKRPSHVYLPFGDGPRICIGKRFAEIEMKLSLVKLLSEFAVEPCEKTETHIKFSNQTLLSIPKHRQIMLKFIPLLPKDSI